MKQSNCRLILVMCGLVGILIIAFASFGYLVKLPGEEPYSELYLLGPQQNLGNYPNDVGVSQNYLVYVGVSNHLGSSGYYVLYVKLINQTDFLPNATADTPSPLQPLYEYRSVIQNNETVYLPLNFSFAGNLVNSDQSLINKVSINDSTIKVDEFSRWDSSTKTYPYMLTVELWLYNAHTNSIEYNSRFVDLQLNFTGKAQST